MDWIFFILFFFLILLLVPRGFNPERLESDVVNEYYFYDYVQVGELIVLFLMMLLH